MGKVTLKMPSWVISIVNAQDSGCLVLEKAIGEGATIGDLLAELTSSYTDFRNMFFNPDVGKVSDQIMVFLNDSLLQGTDVTEAKLNDGDSVMLLPVYSGG